MGIQKTKLPYDSFHLCVSFLVFFSKRKSNKRSELNVCCLFLWSFSGVELKSNKYQPLNCNAKGGKNPPAASSATSSKVSPQHQLQTSTTEVFYGWLEEKTETHFLYVHIALIVFQVKPTYTYIKCTLFGATLV